MEFCDTSSRFLHVFQLDFLRIGQSPYNKLDMTIHSAAKCLLHPFPSRNNVKTNVSPFPMGRSHNREYSRGHLLTAEYISVDRFKQAGGVSFVVVPLYCSVDEL